MTSKRVRVECYDGYRGQQEPRRLVVGGRRLEVTDILTRWSEPGVRAFEVRAEDGACYRLLHDERRHVWRASRLA